MRGDPLDLLVTPMPMRESRPMATSISSPKSTKKQRRRGSFTSGCTSSRTSLGGSGRVARVDVPTWSTRNRRRRACRARPADFERRAAAHLFQSKLVLPTRPRNVLIYRRFRQQVTNFGAKITGNLGSHGMENKVLVPSGRSPDCHRSPFRQIRLFFVGVQLGAKERASVPVLAE